MFRTEASLVFTSTGLFLALTKEKAMKKATRIKMARKNLFFVISFMFITFSIMIDINKILESAEERT